MSQSMVLEDLHWEADAREALERIAKQGSDFDAFSLTQAELRDPPHPNMWGMLFRQAAADGVIKRIGFRESRRPGRRHGVCRVWRAA